MKQSFASKGGLTTILNLGHVSISLFLKYNENVRKFCISRMDKVTIWERYAIFPRCDVTLETYLDAKWLCQ